MKPLSFLITFLFPLVIQAQYVPDIPDLPYNNNTRNIEYMEIVQTPGLSKNDLYKRAKEWFTTYFRSYQDVVQMDDKEEGKIIGKGTSRESFLYRAMGSEYTGNYYIRFTVNLTLKDGKYRILLSNFSTEASDLRKAGIVEGPMEYMIRGITDIRIKDKITAQDRRTGKIMETALNRTLELINETSASIKQRLSVPVTNDDF